MYVLYTVKSGKTFLTVQETRVAVDIPGMQVNKHAFVATVSFPCCIMMMVMMPKEGGGIFLCVLFLLGERAAGPGAWV